MIATHNIRGFAPTIQPIKFSPFITNDNPAITVPTIARPARSASTYTPNATDSNPRPRKRVRTSSGASQITNKTFIGPSSMEEPRNKRTKLEGRRGREIIDLTGTDHQDGQITRGGTEKTYSSSAQPWIEMGGLPELHDSPLFPLGQVVQPGQDQAGLRRTQAIMNALTIQTPPPSQSSQYPPPTPVMQALLDVQRALQQQQILEHNEWPEEQERLEEQAWYEQQERLDRLARSRAETQRQINDMRSTGQLVIHDLESSESIPEDECPICFEVGDVKDWTQLACGHRFHTAPCLVRWFDTANTCPICRANVITD